MELINERLDNNAYNCYDKIYNNYLLAVSLTAIKMFWLISPICFQYVIYFDIRFHCMMYCDIYLHDMYLFLTFQNKKIKIKLEYVCYKIITK